MTQMSTLLDVLPKLAPDGPVNAPFPLTMEQIGQNYGFVLYRTEIPKTFSQSSATLTIASLVRDRAIVYVGKVRQATMFRRSGQSSVTLRIGISLQLDILVENTGRVNAGPRMVDPKGIVGNVTINGTLLRDWQMYPINLSNIVSEPASLGFSPHPLDGNNNVISASDNNFAPSFFHGVIPLNSHGNSVFDTFLQLPGWHKGQAFVNGFNLGRYWPVVGPQDTLFVPASVLSLKPSSINVVLLELDGAPCENPTTCFVEFVATPSINGPVHPIGDES
ncbi:Beta-galactosidase-1-like protein [Desmophyllum pertusum]|uniref:Beta-galactosidase-1-like protein n=1 Tax=Desmophyllum pertusum TaxID=174260 RepID=A0A9W9Z8G1_9CNID|nr:Beta-galactosidase-1-like protein [Desmophyllum pertusum]